jgi:hypothetical protein
MARRSVLASLAFTIVGLAARPGVAVESRPDRTGFETVVAPLLTAHCVKCHGSRKSKGDITLHDIDSEVATPKDVELWKKVLEKISLGEMPPKDEPRPEAAALERVRQWITLELRKSGEAIDVEERRHGPAFGNRVDHEALFSGKHKGPAWSPARLWRISPHISSAKYSNRKQLGRHLHSASQPYILADEPDIKDYATMWRMDGPTLESLLLNADQLVSHQIGLPPAELVAMDEAHRRRVADDTKLDEKKRKAALRKMPSKEAMRWSDKEIHALAHEATPPTEEQTEAVVRRQFRLAVQREPTREELSRYAGMMTDCVDEGGNLEGIRAVLTAILLMPETIYRMELGLGERVADGRRRLSPLETAFALSFALRDIGPDAALMADAKSDRLADRVVIANHVRKWLEEELHGNYRRTQSPRLLRFFQEYFGYTTAPEVFKDGSRHPGHKPRPVSLVEDTDVLIRHILKEDKDVLRELLTTRKVFTVYAKAKAFRRTTPSYNISVKDLLDSGDGDEQGRGKHRGWRWLREVPKSQRAGILTQPSWLTAHSQNFDNDPVLRGKWIYERLLAGTVPDVPITVDATVPGDHGKPLRARFEKTREEYCWSCHQKMNPLGMAFEMYDDVGRFREQELLRDNKTSVAVDASGAIIASGDPKLDGPVDNAIDLMHKLADSPRVRQSFVRYAFRYWMGRNETLDDSPTLIAADKAYVESGGSMKELIESLLTSDSFLYRR